MDKDNDLSNSDKGVIVMARHLGQRISEVEGRVGFS